MHTVTYRHLYTQHTLAVFALGRNQEKNLQRFTKKDTDLFPFSASISVPEPLG